MAKESASDEIDASANISARIQELGDWRGEVLARVRQLIQDADPEVVESWKLRGTPLGAPSTSPRTMCSLRGISLH